MAAKDPPKRFVEDQKTSEILETSSSSKVSVLSVESYQKDTLLNSLFERVSELEKTVKIQEKLIESNKSREKEFANLKSTLSKFFEPDQVQFMCGKQVQWSNSTVQKALMLKYKLGRNFYDETFRKHYAPYWPCSKTCENRIKDFKLIPGILKFNVNILGLKMEKLPVEHRTIGIIFDEKAIIPSQQKDFGINEYRGKVTLQPSENVCKKEGNEPLAKHSLVALGVGSPVREKELLGLHYTAGSTDGKAMKEFIFNLIIYVEENTGVKVQWIGMDLSPTNQSMLKACGISLTKDNIIFKISHPHRPYDWLYILSDIAHDEKNIVGFFRGCDVEIAQKFVEQFNLSSNKASFAFVKKVFEIQQDMDLKPAKKLKLEHLKPSQFDKMKQRIASDVLSSDVSSTIELMDKLSSNDGKKNSTAWLLQILLIFHNIIFDREGWTKDDGKYQDVKEFLIWMADDFFPNLKFSNKLKCIPGVIMSIRSILEIAEENFKNGVPKFIPAHYLNDAIENIFSLVTQIVKKPTAKSIAEALRIISLKQFQFDPTKGNCGWDSTEPISIDLIGELKLFMDNSGAIEDIESDDDDDMPLVKIDDEVTMISLFDNPVHRQVFYYETSKNFNQFVELIECRSCQNHLIDDSELKPAQSELLELRNVIENFSYGTGELKHRPSADLMTFFLRLEFIFQKLQKCAKMESNKFKITFMENASQVFLPNEHCYSTTTTIISHFLENRRHIVLHKYLPHKSLKNASKSLI
jgi:hypothetical protein